MVGYETWKEQSPLFSSLEHRGYAVGLVEKVG